MDAKALVAQKLEQLPEMEPITPDMCEAAIAAAVARTVGRLNGAAYGLLFGQGQHSSYPAWIVDAYEIRSAPLLNR